jgi:hypothetical protein
MTPSTYYHKDWNQRNMDKLGNASCTGWLEGSIVAGGEWR